MSTDLITYLNFIASLEDSTDDQINDIIAERTNFIGLGSSDMMDHCNSAVDSVFDNLHSLAKQLEEEQIAQEWVKLSEDAAAIAGIFSFGISMASWVISSAADIGLEIAIREKEKDLHNHLESADKDIADQMGPVCSKYIDLAKKNNIYLKASSPKGLTPQTARSYVYNYMDFLSTHGGVDLANFRKYIEVARKSKDDANISKIYDLLDEFTLSDDHDEAKLHNILQNINDIGVNVAITVVQFIRSFTFFIWIYKMGVPKAVLRKVVSKFRDIPPEEGEPRTFENMDVVGVAMAVFTIMLSVVDAILNVFAIVDTVERYSETTKTLDDARQQYKDFYRNLHDASTKYKPKQ